MKLVYKRILVLRPVLTLLSKFASCVWSLFAEGLMDHCRFTVNDASSPLLPLTTTKQAKDVVVEWLTLLLPIWEVPDSNLGQETGYPASCHSWFSSVLIGKFQDSTLKLCHDRFLSNPSQFTMHLSPFHSTLYSFSCRKCVIK
jgi:hypothetical protein